MSTLLNKLNTTLSQLPLDEEAKSKYMTAAVNYDNDCGCKWGGNFLFLTLIVHALHWIAFGRSLLSTFETLSLILLITIAGKFLGMGVSKAKLYLLFISLSKRVVA